MLQTYKVRGNIFGNNNNNNNNNHGFTTYTIIKVITGDKVRM